MDICCQNCGFVVRQESVGYPCPDCGGTQWLVRLSDEVSEIHNQLKAIKGPKIRMGSHRKRSPYELTTGDSFSVSSKEWMDIRCEIDREKDIYREKVTNPRTGEVIHSCEEPLSRHLGHGSARQKKSLPEKDEGDASSETEGAK